MHHGNSITNNNNHNQNTGSIPQPAPQSSNTTRLNKQALAVQDFQRINPKDIDISSIVTFLRNGIYTPETCQIDHANGAVRGKITPIESGFDSKEVFKKVSFEGKSHDVEAEGNSAQVLYRLALIASASIVTAAGATASAFLAFGQQGLLGAIPGSLAAVFGLLIADAQDKNLTRGLERDLAALDKKDQCRAEMAGSLMKVCVHLYEPASWPGSKLFGSRMLSLNPLVGFIVKKNKMDEIVGPIIKEMWESLHALKSENTEGWSKQNAWNNAASRLRNVVNESLNGYERANNWNAAVSMGGLIMVPLAVGSMLSIAPAAIKFALSLF